MTIDVTIHNKTFQVVRGLFDGFWREVNAQRWQPETFNILDDFLSDKSNLIDIGASIGPISLYASTRAEKVYAIEADPVTYQELVKNIAENECSRESVACYSMAMSDREGQATLFSRHTFGDAASSLLDKTFGQGQEILVPMMTLSGFLTQEKVDLSENDLIKIDIEGGEFALFQQAAPTLKEACPTLLLSLHSRYLVDTYLQERLPVRWLSKVVNRFDAVIGKPLLTDTLVGEKTKKDLQALVEALSFYQYCYDEYGNLLKPENILDSWNGFRDVIFTNTQWEKH